MKAKKSVADITIELMEKYGYKQISIFDYLLLEKIANKAKHTNLAEKDVTIRQNRILYSLSRDKRFKKKSKHYGPKKTIRMFKLIEV